MDQHDQTLLSPTTSLVLASGVEACRTALRAHYRRLGPRARRLRFMGAASIHATDQIAARARPDLLLEFVDGGVVRGVLEAYCTARNHAEIAISIEDAFQGQGHGRALFEAGLAELSRMGVKTAELYCMAENTAVLHLVRAAGGRMSSQDGEVVAHLHLPRIAPAQNASSVSEVLEA